MPKKDYNQWDKKDLISHIEKLEKRKKYGLVWDEERTKEEFELHALNGLPVLQEVPEKYVSTNNAELTNILIEGDNFHALSVLNYTHHGSIDVIYIDPPYNTGNTSWKYNNNYVERDDAFRHSKWLSFMSKRLQLAKHLLTEAGIIIVAIDDYEHHTLRLLMDEIFGEDNRMGTITVVHNPRGRNDEKFFATMHEYLLVYARNKDLANVGYFELDDDDIDKYNKNDDISSYNETSFMRTGNNSDRHTRPNLFYPIYYNPNTTKLSLEKDKDSIKLLPVNEASEEKTWRWGKNTFEELCDTELLVREVKGKFRIFKKRRVTNIEGKKPKTVWYDPRYDASTYGIMLLQKIFGQKNVFPYPKSLYATLDIIKLTSNKNSTILDFFAGSGTTAHAVMELNALDNGNRKFILCTNNENNICTEVCYPRAKKVMKGYTDPKGKKVKGLGGNLKYYRTSFVPSETSDENKELLTRQSIEILCLKEGTFDFITETDVWKIYGNANSYTAILFDQLSIPDLKTELEKLNKPVNVYIFSLEDDNFANEFANMKKKVKVCSIPEAILRVYRRIYQ